MNISKSIMSRISYIDGLRGVAITIVLLFHIFSRFPEIMPYGYKYFSFPLFYYGWVGVELFFLISGFVILMTLEKCKSYFTFLKKRWLRLFPAMLISTFIIYLSAPLLPERPQGAPYFVDIIPGLSFLSHSIWSNILGRPVDSLDGAFWSIYIEVIFYLIFGLLYYLLGKKKAIIGLIGLFILNIIVQYGSVHEIKIAYYLTKLTNLLGLEFYGWFASGALFYLFYRKKDKKLFASGIVISLISGIFKSIQSTHPNRLLFAYILVIFIFVMPIVFNSIRFLFSSKLLNFVGFISYPLYLIHQNIVVALTIKLAHMVKWLPSFLAPVLPIIIVVGISYIIAKYLEPKMRKFIEVYAFKLKH